jgi:hypothetical protein
MSSAIRDPGCRKKCRVAPSRFFNRAAKRLFSDSQNDGGSDSKTAEKNQQGPD